MRLAVIAFTGRGALRAAELVRGLTENGHTCRGFAFHKYSADGLTAFYSLQKLMEDQINWTEGFLFLSACGIAVRAVAPHLKDKFSDPAVVVLDDAASFAISLLSGHVGGANVLAEEVAALTGAQAVITTATDVNGVFSPDVFAKQNGLLLTDRVKAKEIAAALLAGEQVGFVSDYAYDELPQLLTGDCGVNFGISVTRISRENPFPCTLYLPPRNLVLGVGCRKGTGQAELSEFLSGLLGDHGFSLEEVVAVTSIDLKQDEPGLVGFCHCHGLPFITYSPEQLMEQEGEFVSSDFVRDITGADNICERSAVRYSQGPLVVRKTPYRGMTAAVAEIPVAITFHSRR